MSRDLLYKPPVPVVAPEGDEKGAKTAARPAKRELGSVGKTFEVPAGYTPPSRTAAYRAAYFNQDVSGLGQPNLNQSAAQALRGAESAVRLEKVVLPPPAGVASPDPAQLRGVCDLMGLDGGLELGLESLLARQGAWARAGSTTVEAIAARKALLERMVEDRRRALARMVGPAAARSATLELARRRAGEPLDEAAEVVGEGRELVERTAGQAEGMHRRIARMLGIERKRK